MERRRVLRLVTDVLVTVVGLVLLWWGVVVMGSPTISCRGVEMGPGDVCHKSTFTATHTDTVQTYEQRRRAVAQSRPTVIGLGAATASFGVALTAATLRGSARQDTGRRGRSRRPVGR